MNNSPSVVQITGDLNINTERRMNASAISIMTAALRFNPCYIVIEVWARGEPERLANELLNIARQANCQADVSHIFDDPSFTGVQIKYSSTDVASETIKGIASAFKAANIDYKEITDGLSPDSQPKSIYLSISFKP